MRPAGTWSSPAGVGGAPSPSAFHPPPRSARRPWGSISLPPPHPPELPAWGQRGPRGWLESGPPPMGQPPGGGHSIAGLMGIKAPSYLINKEVRGCCLCHRTPPHPTPCQGCLVPWDGRREAARLPQPRGGVLGWGRAASSAEPQAWPRRPPLSPPIPKKSQESHRRRALYWRVEGWCWRSLQVRTSRAVPGGRQEDSRGTYPGLPPSAPGLWLRVATAERRGQG